MCSQSIFLVSLEWQRNKEQNLEKHLQLIIGIYVSDLPLNSTGRSSSSLRHHLGTMPPAPQACITYVPQKELQTKVTLTSHCAPAAAASPCMNASQLPFIRRYHTASTRTSWCYTAKITSLPCCTFNSFALFCLLKKKKPPPSLSLQRLDESCLLPSIFAQHYWPYHWRKSELPCRGKLEFRAR